jgi:histidyl-tRNA synthetase
MAVIQSPKGTRDFYPREMLVRRYITDAWRRTALRHGFDEIDGPTFESAELYAVKSGEGILSEMFGVFSGKDPEDVERVKAGAPPLGLRPEFTPTLARMYAARAKQLPQPTKWFCVSNFFRAEKPQRGRLREFFQWNCDVIGGEDKASGDAEVIATAIAMLDTTGLGPHDAKANYYDRRALLHYAKFMGLSDSQVPALLDLVDRKAKLSAEALRELGASLRLPDDLVAAIAHSASVKWTLSTAQIKEHAHTTLGQSEGIELLAPLVNALEQTGLISLDPASSWCKYNSSIVRGLAYYTGTVFEVIAEGERAVAGGGRYDNLIELFGGPPTAACGFGMGDVVLANLLNDRGLMPEGRDLVEALCEPMPVRPDVFVVASPNERCDEAVTPLVARMRRGVETERYVQSQSASDAAARMKPWDKVRYAAGEGGVRPLHARRSYKATKNVGKLLADAGSCFARWAAIVERVEDVAALEGVCTLKNMETQEQRADVPLRDVGRIVAG